MPVFFTACAIVTAIVAVVTDLRSRRIPNALTFASAGLAIVSHAVVPQGLGLWGALSGLGVGFLVFFPVFLLRGMGAGDVKLLAALGAWVGAGLVLWTGFYTALAGGVLAIGVAIARRYTRQLFANVWLLLTHWRVTGIRPVDGFTLQTATSPRLPYALPIFTGLVLTLWLKQS